MARNMSTVIPPSFNTQVYDTEQIRAPKKTVPLEASADETTVNSSEAENQHARATYEASEALKEQEANSFSIDEAELSTQETLENAAPASKISFEFKDGKLVTDSNDIKLFIKQFGTALVLMGADIEALSAGLATKSFTLDEIETNLVVKELESFHEDLVAGTALEQALTKLDDQTKFVLSGLLGAKSEDLKNIVGPLLEHGPVIQSSAKLDTSMQSLLDKSLAKLAGQAGSRTDLVKSDLDYSKKLGGLQADLHQLCADHLDSTEKLRSLPPVIELRRKRELESKFGVELSKIERKYGRVIGKEDLESLGAAIKDIRQQAKEETGFLDKLGDWKSMVFSKEGFAAVTTLLPALATMVQGALNMVGLGKVAQPLTALAHGAGAIAEKVFHMVFLFGQRETNQALASKATEPAPARDPKATKQAEQLAQAS